MVRSVKPRLVVNLLNLGIDVFAWFNRIINDAIRKRIHTRLLQEPF